MKTVVVHAKAARVELDWATQFAGLDIEVKKQFSAFDWMVRVPKVFTIPDFTWDGIVKTVSAAGQAAGSGGVVVIASGHGGAVRGPGSNHNGDPNGDGGVINWDPTDVVDVDRDWTPAKVHKGLFWDDTVARYLQPIPFGNLPNRKGEDERNIKNKVKDFDVLQKRHDAFEALEKIGQALSGAGVARLTFTVCTAGRATAFMNRIAKICKVEVACFTEETRVLDDHSFGFHPGKSRLVMESDKGLDGKGTNVLSARVFSPNLDDSGIAFVAKP